MALSRSLFAKVAESAFNAIGDIKQPVTYRRVSSVYSPTTGGLTSTNTDYTINAVMSKFKSFEVDRVSIMALDMKVMILQADLPVVPATATDVILFGNLTYAVINYQADPAGATYTIQVRAK